MKKNDVPLNLTELNTEKSTKGTSAATVSKIDTSEYEFKWCCVKLNLPYEKFNWKFTFAFLCLCCFFQNFATSGVSSVVLSTIEREFFWSSTQSGFFLGLFELAAFIASPLFGFLGGRFNKMKLISVSLFLVMLGSYTIGFTIFYKAPDLDSQYFNTNRSQQICKPVDKNTSDSDCSFLKNNLLGSNLQYLIYIGHFIIGFGSVALYTIGVAHIEDITTEKQSSYCQAIYYGLGKKK